MRKVGIVASGSTEISASLVLAEEEEKRVKAEDLVQIRNRNGNVLMAVCRGGLGNNENLKIGAYSPGVAYARIGHHPSNAKEYYAFGLDTVGDISSSNLKENKMLIAPCSDVELYEESDNPINHYWFGSKFLEYCVKQGWLRQEGSGGRGTKWYPTDKGRKELKEKFGIEV